MPEEQQKTYLTEYRDFITAYQQGAVSAEGVGELVARLAQYFAETNLRLNIRSKMLNDISASIAQGADENTGKAISVAKAEILVKATPESKSYNDCKIDIQNIEQYINALKCLQKGVLNEYAHVST